jgi:hypothetical protein
MGENTVVYDLSLLQWVARDLSLMMTTILRSRTVVVKFS